MVQKHFLLCVTQKCHSSHSNFHWWSKTLIGQSTISAFSVTRLSVESSSALFVAELRSEQHVAASQLRWAPLSTDLFDLAGWIKRAAQSRSCYEVMWQTSGESRQAAFNEWSFEKCVTFSVLSACEVIELPWKRWWTPHVFAESSPLTWPLPSVCYTPGKLYPHLTVWRGSAMMEEESVILKKKKKRLIITSVMITVRGLAQQDYFIRPIVTATTNFNYNRAIPVIWQ